jgi:hypothetical protein
MPILAGFQFRQRLKQIYLNHIEQDLRRAYVAIIVIIILGVAVNWFLPHGWTVWPLVGMMGMLLMVNEAAERNGQGVPPLQVYAMFAVGIGAWIVIVAVLSVLNLTVLTVGIGGVLYYAVKGYVRQRERDRLIAYRRVNRLCIYCGEPADPEAVFCLNCGEEPNPDVLTMRRVAAIVRSPGQVSRTRAALTPAPPTAGVAAKEAALLQRRPRPGKK